MNILHHKDVADLHISIDRLDRRPPSLGDRDKNEPCGRCGEESEIWITLDLEHELWRYVRLVLARLLVI